MAKALKIEHCVLDLRGEFKEKVMDYFAAEYLRGATSNPCVVCNREIKFGAMLKFALENGGDYVATGHYASLDKKRRTHSSCARTARKIRAIFSACL